MRGVDIQAFFHRVFLVVFALNQGLRSDVVHPCHFGGVEFEVVGATAREVHAPPTHALNDVAKGYIDFKHVVQMHTRCFHGIRLGQGAGKAVEQKTSLAVVLLNSFFHQADDDLVTHQGTRVHDFFGLQPHRRPRFDRCAQHVTG